MCKWDPQPGLRLNGKGHDGGGVSIKLHGQQVVVRHLLVILAILQPPISSSSLGTGPVLCCLWRVKESYYTLLSSD